MARQTPAQRPGSAPGSLRRPGTAPGPLDRPARRPARRFRRLLILGIGAAAALLFVLAGVALAYFVTTDSSHPAQAAAATLAVPTAGAQNGTATTSTVPIKWTTPTGYTPTGYTVLRCTGSTCSPTSINNGTCSGTVSTTSCTDTDSALAAGTTYTYEVEAKLDFWVSSPGNSFTAATSAVSSLTFTAQPSSGQNINSTSSFSVSVAINDSNGNIVTSGTGSTDSVTLAIGTNPSSGVLTCTNTGGLTVTATAGVANFTGCAITKSGNGYTLTASDGTHTGATAPGNANSFNITAGSATKLGFILQPTLGQNIQATGTGSVNVSVAIEDSNGNTVTSGTGSTDSVTLAIGTNPSSGVLTCTNTGGLTVTATAGVANFTGCAITKTGTGYTLTGSDNTHTSYTTTTSNSFNITAGSAAKLVYVAQPGGQNIPATGTGSAFSVTVAIEDTNGNVVTSGTGSTDSLTLAIASNPSGGVLTCTNTGGLTVSASSGEAFYTGCNIAKVGTGYSLIASDGTHPSVTSVTSGSFNVIAGPAAKLGFTTQPTSNQNIQATGTGTFSVSVAVQDSDGNTVTTGTGSTDSVTLAIKNNPGGGVLSCTNNGGLTVSAAGGVASFTGCAITKVGTGYTLTATDNTRTLTAPANANSFNIIAGAAAGLTFTGVEANGQATTITCSGTVGTTFSCTLATNPGGGGTMLAYVVLIDQNQNPVDASSTITINLSKNHGFLNVNSVQIPSGSSTSSTAFTETLNGSGQGTVTATEGGFQGQLVP